nr:FAD-dependent monooxygenase [Sphingomonas quercus]
MIVGGGPAGAAAAIRLARAGHRPLLIERERTTADALCGGFLSWRTLEALGALGVDPFALGARAVTQVRLFAGARTVAAALPGRAAGLSRRALDGALLARVDAVERGVAAREAEPGRVRLDDGGEVTCDALFLATGKHELRGLARPRAGGDPVLGLRLRLAAAPGLARLLAETIELHLFDRGYAGLVLQEDGSANLCLAVHRSRLDAAGGRPEALIDALGRESPRLGERLGAGASGPVQAVANIPYGWRAEAAPPGLYRLGDQAAVIPSLAGEGIGIALASAAHAVAACVRRAPFQPPFARAAARPLRIAGMIRDIAERPGLAGPALALLGAAPWLLGPAMRLTRIGGDFDRKG